MPALYCISILRRYFCEKLYDTATSSFISCFTSVLILVDIIFHNFFELYSTLSEKDFRRKFSLLNGFTHHHSPDPLNGQNLLSVTNFFCQFSLRCPLKHFSLKIC